MEDWGGANIETQKPKASRHLWLYGLMLLAVVLAWVFNEITNGEMAICSLLVDIAYDVDCILCKMRNGEK